jgi:hypothetical protein
MAVTITRLVEVEAAPESAAVQEAERAQQEPEEEDLA